MPSSCSFSWTLRESGPGCFSSRPKVLCSSCPRELSTLCVHTKGCGRGARGTHAGGFLSGALDAFCDRLGCFLDAGCPRRERVLAADRLGLLATKRGVSPVFTLRAHPRSVGSVQLTSPTPSPELYRRAEVERDAVEDRIGAMRRERWGSNRLEDDCRETARATDWRRGILTSLVGVWVVFALCRYSRERERAAAGRRMR